MRDGWIAWGPLVLVIVMAVALSAGCRRRGPNPAVLALANDPNTCTIEVEGRNLGGTLVWVGPGDSGLVMFRGRYEREVGVWQGQELSVRGRGAGSFDGQYFSLRGGGTGAPITATEMAAGATEAGGRFGFRAQFRWSGVCPPSAVARAVGSVLFWIAASM